MGATTRTMFRSGPLALVAGVLAAIDGCDSGPPELPSLSLGLTGRSLMAPLLHLDELLVRVLVNPHLDFFRIR